MGFKKMSKHGKMEQKTRDQVDYWNVLESTKGFVYTLIRK